MRIAVIGAGISGLGAAWLASREHHVTLYEKAPRIGGHAHTVDAHFNDVSIAVDTGFIVYNEANYPNLIGYLIHWGSKPCQQICHFRYLCAGKISNMKALCAD